MKIHHCFLWSLLFLFCGGFAMEQNGAIANVPQPQNGIMKSSTAHLPTMHTFFQTKDANGNGVCCSNRTAYNMQKLLEEAAHKEICKMELLVGHVCEQVDKDLRVDPLGRILGSWRDWGKISERSALNAIKELQKIESYIPAQCSSSVIYDRLIKKHQYVASLVDEIVVCRVALFKNDENSRFDSSLNKKLSKPLSEFIKKRSQGVGAKEEKGGMEQTFAVSMMYLFWVAIIVMM
jgi:hypothetical protein